MNKYVALLRGINVGGNNKVEMKRLKEVFEKLGYKNVFTYINSGNVIFESNTKDFSKIESAIKNKFGFAVKVLVVEYSVLQKIAKKIPKTWQNNRDQRTDILFLWDSHNSKKSLGLIKQTKDIDNLLYIPGAIVWNFNREHYKKSGMHKFIGTEVYKNMTARNLNTLRKLEELMKKTR